MHPFFFPIGRVLARMTQNSTLAYRFCRRFNFKGKLLIVSLMRPRSRQIIADCDGLKFALDLKDDVQREIYFGVFDARDLQVIRSLVPAGGVCMDVGANVGLYSLHMARLVGPGGQVHAFEPDPRNHLRLSDNGRLNFTDNRIVFHQLAISNQQGMLPFNRAGDDSTGLGSLCHVTGPSAGQINVPVTTLDDFIDRQGIDAVDLMKVDIEAHEPEMMQGAERSLRSQRFHYILMEFNGHLLAERQKTFADYLAMFSRYGYKPVQLNLDLLAGLKAGVIDPLTACKNFLFECPDWANADWRAMPSRKPQRAVSVA